MRLLGVILVIGTLGLLGHGLEAEEPVGSSMALADPAAVRDESVPPPLPHWREGGTPYDSNQSLHPYAVRITAPRDVPLSGQIASPPEYDPVHGVLFFYMSSQWPTVVRDLVVALTADPAHDEIAYVVVTSTSQQSAATSAFVAGGADMSKVQFIIEPGNALWIRDYGPHFIWQDGALALVDSHYYPTRPLDNFMPTLLGDDHLKMPTYDMGLYYSGGNFQPGPDGTAFVTSLINLDNPTSEGFTGDFIAELFQVYQGIDTLHVMPQLPFSVDGTGHIDMWMYLVDEDSVLISEFKPGSDATAIQITDNAVPYMEALGFTVERPRAWNVGSTHYTYTNGFRVNDRVFIPRYGGAYVDDDAHAKSAWSRAVGPGVEIIQINCASIIPAAGAIHCIVMQVPRYVEATPAPCVISPKGGELLVCGTTHTISWVATDTNNVTIPQVDLYYSVDDGGSYDHIITTTNTGTYEWTVPEVSTTEARVKVIVTAADSDQAEAVSPEVFQIAPAQQAAYDFATDAGVDRFGYGHQTSSWILVDNNRTPVTTEVDTLVSGAYAKLAASDATGSDADSNRYIAPNPSLNWESTHIFEFTIQEDPAIIDDIGIHWEGYADQCAQIELYVWDYLEGQWSDGKGLYDQNRFMDNWAGNRDGYLEGHIRSNFDRYVDPDGQMTILLYTERGTAYYGGYLYTPSFHDYMAITVTTGVDVAGDFDGDGVVDLIDYTNFADCMEGPDVTPSPTLPDVTPQDCLDIFDFESDGDVDLEDFQVFMEALGAFS
jgi:agmatine deiminase